MVATSQSPQRRGGSSGGRRPAGQGFSRGRQAGGRGDRHSKSAGVRAISARTVEAMQAAKQARQAVPEIKITGNPPKMRVYALGGLEEVGRNCTVFECGEDIVIIDAGLMFPEENMPGIDFIVPNISSLKGKEKNIRGIIVSHGHLDHVGGLPYILPALGWPAIYTAPLTAGIIRNRQEEFKNAGRLKIQNVTSKSRVQLGRHFIFEPFHVNHNISDAFGTALHTPYGVILGTGDFKFDFTPADGDPADLIHIAGFGAKQVLMLMSDSTNATSPGHQISEKTVGEELHRVIERAPGRVFIGTFSSMLTRFQQIVEIAEATGRHVLIQGRSLLNNVELAHKLGYMKYKPGTLVEKDEIKRLPENKVVIVCTGAQGEKNAALMRIASHEHPVLSLQPGDTVMFSSSVVPGNERTVQRLKDTIVRQGAKVVDSFGMDIHAGGHAKQEDLKLMLRLTRPVYFMPIHGNRYMLEAHAELAESVGTPRQNCLVADNGQVIEFDKSGAKLTSEHVPVDYVMVDGLGVGDVSDVVLRDRNELAADGMVVVVTRVSGKSNELLGVPDVVSRGFVHMKDNRELIIGVKDAVKKAFAKHSKDSVVEDDLLRASIRNSVGEFVMQKTQRRPMILPVIVRV